jgi:hypothetical protein
MPVPQSYETHNYLPRPSGAASLFTLIALICFVADRVASREIFGMSLTGWGLFSLTAAVFTLTAISRWYTTALQDRIIRLEMRVRLKELLPPDRHVEIERLRIDQLVALRFASDAELPDLVRRTLDERLTRDQVKRAIKDWQGDYLRT